jgi:anti-anti-sigma factor
MQTAVGKTTRGFGVEGRHTDGVTALRVSGRLVVGDGAGDATWQNARDWRGARRIVVDLGAVTALDAGGVGALLRLRQNAQRYGVAVTIAAASARARRVLRLTHVDGVFGFAPATPSGPAGLASGLLWRCA